MADLSIWCGYWSDIDEEAPNYTDLGMWVKQERIYCSYRDLYQHQPLTPWAPAGSQREPWCPAGSRSACRNQGQGSEAVTPESQAVLDQVCSRLCFFNGWVPCWPSPKNAGLGCEVICDMKSSPSHTGGSDGVLWFSIIHPDRLISWPGLLILCSLPAHEEPRGALQLVLPGSMEQGRRMAAISLCRLSVTKQNLAFGNRGEIK